MGKLQNSQKELRDRTRVSEYRSSARGRRGLGELKEETEHTTLRKSRRELREDRATKY